MTFGQRRGTAVQNLLDSGYRYALALVVDEVDAYDLVHDAWVKLYPRFGKLPDKALLLRTIRTLFIDTMRHRQRFEKVEFDENRMEGYYNDSEGFNGSEPPDRQLIDALEKLRSVEREILFLSVVEGYTAEEIAVLTERPRGSVLSLLHRTKHKLRNTLSDSNATEYSTTSETAPSVKLKEVH